MCFGRVSLALSLVGKPACASRKRKECDAMCAQKGVPEYPLAKTLSWVWECFNFVPMCSPQVRGLKECVR